MTQVSVSNFDVRFLEPAKEFIENLDSKTREKVLFNIWKSKEIIDPKLFKKLDRNIWEFRTIYKSRQIRLFAFWDRKNTKTLLVVTTHGIIKKTQKTPLKEIVKAEGLRKKYFETMQKS